MIENYQPSCIVPSCNSKCKTSKVYPLPTAKEVWKKWFQKINRPNFKPSPTSVICYRHFHEHDYIFSHFTHPNGSVKRKRILKPTAIPSLQLSAKNASKKVDIPTIDIKPKEMGWYTCSSCSNEKTFLYFFELMAHYCEIHGFQSLVFNSKARSYYDELMTPTDFIEKEKNLAKYGWTCQMCCNGETFEHKFQLVSHWLKNHSINDVIYEVCQWCSEVFLSTESSAKVIEIYK